MKYHLFHILPVLLNQLFGYSEARYLWKHDRRRFFKKYLLYLCFIGFLPIFLEYLEFIHNLYTFLPGSQKYLILVFPVVSGQMIVIILGVFYIIGAFYMSKSVELLLPHPIPTTHIIGALFLLAVAGEYITLLFIYAPPVISYGIRSNVSLLFWIYSIVLFLLLPFLPLSLVSIPIMVVMRYVNLARKKDMLRIATGIVMVCVILGFHIWFQRTNELQDTANGFQSFLMGKQSAITHAGKFFPPFLWAAETLIYCDTPEGLHYFVLFLAAICIGFTAMLLTGNKLFIKGVLGGDEVSTRIANRGLMKPLRSFQRSRNPMKAYFVKELLIFFRNPYFVMNYVLTFILPLLILGFTMFYSENRLFDLYLFIAGGQRQEWMLSLLSGGIILGIVSYNSMFISSTGISREGRRFWISRIIPLPPWRQVLIKILHSWLSAQIIVVAGVAAIYVTAHLSVWRLLVTFYVGCVGTVVIVVIGLCTDLVSPHLQWIDPHRVIKGNLRPLVALCINFIWIISSGYIFYRACFDVERMVLPIIAILMYLAVLAAGATVLLLRFATRRYPGIPL
jgi:ABC-2 type transport system permease protein